MVDFSKRKPIETTKVVTKVTKVVDIEPEKTKEVKPRIKKETEPSTWIKCTKEQHDEMIKFLGFLERLLTMNRFNPDHPDNIKHGRKDGPLLKKGVELMEKIL
jgi:hypothetical protein